MSWRARQNQAGAGVGARAGSCALAAQRWILARRRARGNNRALLLTSSASALALGGGGAAKSGSRAQSDGALATAIAALLASQQAGIGSRASV